MTTNQSIENETAKTQVEGRGLCRALALGVLLVVATVAGCVFTGCASLQAEFDRAVERIRIALDKPDDGGTVETPTAPQPEEPTAPGATVDAVPYSSLNWSMGGFRGAGALQHSGAVIGSLSVKSNGMSYRWVRGGCEQLGAADKGDASKTLACLFYLDASGKWQGGKFDWISTSRTTRDFKNIHDGYNGWNAAEFDAATEFAFVVVSADGRRRSNVVIAEAK